MRQDPYAGIAVRKDPARPQQRQPAPQAQDPYAGIAVRQNPPPTRNRQTPPPRGQTPPPPAPAEPQDPVYAPTPNIPQAREKREVTLPDGSTTVIEVPASTPDEFTAPTAPPAPGGYDRFMSGVLAAQPGFRPAAGAIAGGARGVARIAGGAYGLLGQAADRLGLDGIGNAMIDQANAFQGGASRLNAPFRAAEQGLNMAGQVLGETAATIPVLGGLGTAVGAGGRAIAAGARSGLVQGTGNVIARVGQSISAGGFTPAAAGRPLLERTAVRAVGGAVSGGGGAALLGQGGEAGGTPGERRERTLPDGTKIVLVGPGARPEDIVGGMGPGDYLDPETGTVYRRAPPAGISGMDEVQVGAAIGAFLPTIARRPASFVANRFADGFEMLTGQFGKVRARQIIKEALGGVDPDDAIAAMRNAAPGETATQAMVSAGLEPSAFMAGGALARSVDPDTFLAIDAAQAAARQAPIDRLAGGTNLNAAQMAAGGERQTLRAATVPMQQAELAAADASGALNVAPVVSQLMRMADAPGVGTTNARVLADVASALDAMAARRGGVPSAEDIYAFRKDDLDDIITRALSAGRGGEVTSQAARRSEMVRATQDMLDSAIEQAGGASWRNYLANYASGMRSIERQQMMGVLGRQLRKEPGTFVDTIGGENPAIVENVFGPGRGNLNAMMNPTGVGPSGMDALTRAAREVRRDERIGVLAREGGGRFGEILAGQDPGRFIGRARNVIAGSAGGPATAMALDVGERLLAANISKQTRAKLAEAYRSGANMRRLLELTPLAERLEVRLALQGLLINSMVSPGQQGNAMGEQPLYTAPQ